ncbi:hypothetical protein ACSBR2_042744 [Camellia fascicularis]
MTERDRLDLRGLLPPNIMSLEQQIERFMEDLKRLHDRKEKLWYSVRGKKPFPVTPNALLRFNIKGQCDVDKEFKERKSRGAAEFTWGILNFQKDQDIRLKVGYEVFDEVPYLQVRENNWMLNVDVNGKRNVRYDL